MASPDSWGGKVMRATKFAIWWHDEGFQRTPWDHRGVGFQSMPWDGYPRWVLDARIQARAEAPRMRCPTLAELPARGRHVAHHWCSGLPRMYRPEWNYQMPGMEDTFL